MPSHQTQRPVNESSTPYCVLLDHLVPVPFAAKQMAISALQHNQRSAHEDRIPLLHDDLVSPAANEPKSNLAVPTTWVDFTCRPHWSNTKTVDTSADPSSTTTWPYAGLGYKRIAPSASATAVVFPSQTQSSVYNPSIAVPIITSVAGKQTRAVAFHPICQVACVGVDATHNVGVSFAPTRVVVHVVRRCGVAVITRVPWEIARAVTFCGIGVVVARVGVDATHNIGLCFAKTKQIVNACPSWGILFVTRVAREQEPSSTSASTS